jgi:hypothetical protein
VPALRETVPGIESALGGVPVDADIADHLAGSIECRCTTRASYRTGESFQPRRAFTGYHGVAVDGKGSM